MDTDIRMQIWYDDNNLEMNFALFLVSFQYKQWRQHQWIFSLN